MKTLMLLISITSVLWAGDTTMSTPVCKYTEARQNGWRCIGPIINEVCNDSDNGRYCTTTFDLCKDVRKNYDTISWYAPCRKPKGHK